MKESPGRCVSLPAAGGGVAEWQSLRVEPEAVPADVVTLSSTVRVTDLESGAAMDYTIVMPGEANYDAGRISVLAPLGTALLGYRVGDEIEWDVPRGIRRLRIDAVLFQPEAAAHTRAGGGTEARSLPEVTRT